MNRRLVAIILGSAIIVISLIIFFKQSESTVKTNATEDVIEEVSKEYPVEIDVPVDKSWEIDFEKTINDETLNNVYVKDSKGNKVKVKVTVVDRTLYISPPPNGYKPGEYYEIHILKELAYKDGKTIKNPIRIDFLTISKRKIDVTLNSKVKEMSFIPQREQGQFDLNLDEKVSVGDILVIPNENGEKIAYKISKINPPQQGSNVQKIETEEPAFLELFDHLDLNATIPVTSGSTEVVPQEGVTLKKKVAYNFKDKYASISKKTTTSDKKKAHPTGDYQVRDGKIISLSGNVDVDNKEEMLEFTFTDFKLRVNDTVYILNGTFDIDSDIHVEVKKSKDGNQVEEYKLASNTITYSNLEYSVGSNLPMEAISVEIPLAEGMIPIAEFPIIQTEYQMNFVASVDLKGALTFHIETSNNVDAGMIMKNPEDFDPFFNISGTKKMLNTKGAGSVDAKAGVSLMVGLSALGVVGAGVEVVGGYEFDAKSELNIGNKNELCLSYYAGPFLEAYAYTYLFKYYNYKFPYVSLENEMENIKDKAREKSTVCERYNGIVTLNDSNKTTIAFDPDYVDGVEVVKNGNEITFLNKELPQPNDDYLGKINTMSLSEWESINPDIRSMLHAVYLKDGDTVFVLTFLTEPSLTLMDAASRDQSIMQRHNEKMDRLKYYLLKSGFKYSGIAEAKDLPTKLDQAEKAGIEYIDAMTNDFLGDYLKEIKQIKSMEEWNSKIRDVLSRLNWEYGEIGAGYPPFPLELEVNYFSYLNAMQQLQHSQNEWGYKSKVLELESINNEINNQLQNYYKLVE